MQPSLFNSTNSDTSNLAKMLLNTWICASASIGFTKSTLNEDVFVDMPFDDLVIFDCFSPFTSDFVTHYLTFASVLCKTH